MAQVEIDGRSYVLEDGQNLLHACLSEKLEIPYFCWHPAMGSVGSCRLCAVIQYADAEDERGRLQMACMLKVQDGMRLSVGADFATRFRSQVIEWLMENHPHDCPVCEEGGECHLQDMTVLVGHTRRQYRGPKRTWRNQYLGPLVGHEMNRCITCYRCVRFYRDYAGGTDLEAFGSRARMYFGRQEDGVLESEFAGNLVEVCPTGVFTDKPFSATYTRKWDLQSAPSVCPGCAVGCNTLPGERYGSLKRVHNRYHPDVNGYFLCDRGRFGGHFVNAPERLKQAGARAEDGMFEPLDEAAALARMTQLLSAGRVLGIGSPRASLESNFALQSLVGAEHFSAGVSAGEAALNQRMLALCQSVGARIATLAEVEAADAVLILGEDLSNTAPRLALAVRQACRDVSLQMASEAGIPLWQDAGVRGHAQAAISPLLLATPTGTRLDDLASVRLCAAPEDIAAAGFELARRLNAESAPMAEDESEAFVAAAVAALGAAKRPLIVSGTSLATVEVLEAAAAVARALCARGQDASLLFAGPEANTLGVTLLTSGAHSGISLEAALESLRDGSADAAVILENDLYRRLDAARVSAALAAGEILVLDMLETRTAAQADLALPAASVHESTGTYVNYEGRAQRFFQVFQPGAPIAPAWRWLADAAEALGRNDCRWRRLDDLIAACAERPGLAGLKEAAPPSAHRSRAGRQAPRMTHRASGRTAKDAHQNIHEGKTPEDTETPLAYTMEGQNQGQPSALMPLVWTPGWNSNQSLFKFQQAVGGELSGGEVGVRLIEPAPQTASDQETDAALAEDLNRPARPDGRAGQARLVPIYQVFGSDELSAASPPIAELTAPGALLLHPQDAAEWGLGEGEGARLEGDELPGGSLPVRLDAQMARGCVGVRAGLADGLANLPRQGRLLADPDFTPASEPEVIARG